MKLLLFAHIPPPHHGQSAMVKLMLDGFGGDCRKGGRPNEYEVACYHVDCRLSSSLGEIGEIQISKILKTIRYSLEAIWCRFRYGVTTFYYVPAPGKRAALFRDWIVLSLCRPFFKNFVFHWHAAGLGDWVATNASLPERWITKLLFTRSSMGFAIAAPGLRDPLWFLCKKATVIPNGIPDPCPHFRDEILPLRKRRAKQLRETSPATRLEILFIALCSEEKGLFDALEAVAIFNKKSPSLQSHLTVAGDFENNETKDKFYSRIQEDDLRGAVDYKGFVSGAQKALLLKQSDILCFPTFYSAESFGLVLIEAMAYGVTCVSTLWRSIPEIFPTGYEYLAPVRNPEAIAQKITQAIAHLPAEELRAHFEANFSAKRHLELLAKNLHKIE